MSRLPDGHPVVIKGKIARKPMAARDFALVAAITYDKRALCRNQPAPSTEADYAVHDIAEWWKMQCKAKMAGQEENSRG